MSQPCEDVKQGFGMRLRQLREQIGVSVPKFAARVGVDRSYIYKLEHGLADNPSLKFIEAVVLAFGVDREWFVGGVGDGTALHIRTTPHRSGLNGYIRSRLDCLEQVIEACDGPQLEAALRRFNELADGDREFGKIFSEVATVIAHVALRKLSKQAAPADSAPPRSRKRGKSS